MTVYLAKSALDLMCLGQPERAVEGLRQAQEMYRRYSDRVGEGHVLVDFGVAHGLAGSPNEQFIALDRAEQIMTECNDCLGQATVLRGRDRAAMRARRFDEAITALDHAAQIFGDCGDSPSACCCLWNCWCEWRSTLRGERRGLLAMFAAWVREHGHLDCARSV